jgi:hypothetical protein
VNIKIMGYVNISIHILTIKIICMYYILYYFPKDLEDLGRPALRYLLLDREVLGGPDSPLDPVFPWVKQRRFSN